MERHDVVFCDEYFKLIQAIESIDNRSTTIKGFSSTFFAAVAFLKSDYYIVVVPCVVLIFCAMCWYLESIWSSRKIYYIKAIESIENGGYCSEGKIWSKMKNGAFDENIRNVFFASRWRTVAFPHVFFICVLLAQIVYVKYGSKSAAIAYCLLHVLFTLYMFFPKKETGKWGRVCTFRVLLLIAVMLLPLVIVYIFII